VRATALSRQFRNVGEKATRSSSSATAGSSHSATVRAAVRFYGGSIACDSAPGRGTVFTVRLPLKCPRPSPLLI